MSTLTQLQSSIAQTQSLLSQAQNISFNVQRIQTAYSTSYGTAAGTGSTTAMVANAQTRWQNSVAAFEDSLKIQAGVVGNILDQFQRHDLAGHGQPERHRRPSGGTGRQPALGPAIAAALRLWSGCCRPRAGPTRWSRRAPPRPRRKVSRTIKTFAHAQRLSCRATSPCSAAIEAPRCWAGRTHSASPRSSR